MKISRRRPGTSAWQDLRIGVATASNFEKILTPAKLAFSSQAEKYAMQLLAEEHLGMKLDDAVSSSSMTRGDVLEKKALGLYRLQHDDVELRRIGFVTRDDGRVGCSPDHFVNDDGMLEIKSPEPVQHVAYLIDSKGIGYVLQVQGGLWLCEKDYCDTMSYHPDMPPALVRQGVTRRRSPRSPQPSIASSRSRKISRLGCTSSGCSPATWPRRPPSSDERLMRILVDARYARYLKAELVLLVAKIGRDKAYREEEDEIAASPTCPTEMLDDTATGDVLIVIDEPDPADARVFALPEPLKAAS
jgi:hypothetical protein